VIRIDQISTKTAAKNQPILPFAGLIALLRAEGFQLKPDDYLEMLKVVENSGTDDPAHLKYRLCPLVVTSEEEQKKFYKVFDEYTRQVIEQDVLAGKPRSFWSRYRVWIYIAILAAIVTGLYFFIRQPGPPKADYTTGFVKTVRGSDGYSEETSEPGYHAHALPGDTIKVKATAVFNAATWDTSYITSNPGVQTIPLKITTGDHGQSISYDTVSILTTAKSLLTLQNDSGQPQLGQTVTISPLFRGDTSAPGKRIWMVGDSVLPDTSEKLTYSFKTPGAYQVRYIYEPVPGDSVWDESKDISFNIQDPSGLFNMGVVQSGARLAEAPYLLNPWLWWILLLAPALVFVYAVVRDRKAQKKAISTTGRPDRPTDPPEKEKPGLPPFEVPMENRDLQLIAREQAMNPLFRSMRNKVEDERLALNIPGSIRTIIRTGGIPDLVFTNRLRQEEYLILIDEAHVKGQQLHLFNYLVRLLEDELVCIQRFYYRSFDSFYNNDYPSGISLKRLQELYRGDTLILFGTGAQLIHHAFPAVEPDKLSLLEEWQHKAILTPTPWPDWGTREKALKKHFILLPADVQGQVQLIRAIKEKQLQQDKFLAEAQIGYEAHAFYFSDVRELQEYLADDDLFQWLCAICVYPKIRWEVIVEVGKALFSRMGKPEKLNFTNLLKLVRIQWIQEGTFPENTRLELLKRLTVPNELTARETILHLLKYAGLYFRDDHVFRSEKDMQQLTNEFILYTNGGKEEYKPAYELFKQRWDNKKVFDGPLKRYLDKKEGDSWSTPVLLDGKNTGIREYFGDTDKKVAEDKRKHRRRPYYRALSVLAVSLVILLFNKAIFDNGLGRSLHLVNQDNATARQVNLQLALNDTCRLTYRATAADAKGKLTLGEDEYPFVFSGTSASLSVPAKHLQDSGRLSLSLTNSAGRPLSTGTPIRLTNADIALRVDRLCVTLPYTPPPDTAARSASTTAFTPTSLPNNLSEIWQGGSSNRFINIDLSQQVVYYSVSDTKTFGTYHIDQVLGNNAGVYKLILGAGRQGSRVFFIKNVHSNSFDLSVCANFYLRLDQAQLVDTANCDHFNTMRLYYDINGVRIYLPANIRNPMNAAQKQKLAAALLSDGAQSLTYSATYRRNSKYLPVATDYDPVLNPLIAASADRSKLKDGKVTLSEQEDPTPFDRSYLLVDKSTISDNAPATPAKDVSTGKDVTLGEITLDARGYPSKEGQVLIDQVIARLRGTSAQKIRLQATVAGGQKGTLEYGMTTIENLLMKGLGDMWTIDKVLTDAGQQQVQQQKKDPYAEQKSPTITIIGLNFPAGFSLTPNKAKGN
jgi:hypothetical protein